MQIIQERATLKAKVQEVRCNGGKANMPVPGTLSSNGGSHREERDFGLCGAAACLFHFLGLE